MDKNFSEEIAFRKAILQDISVQMAEVKKKFVEEAVPFARDWMLGVARQYVESYPEIAMELGQENISQLKKKVQMLSGTIDEYCREIYSQESFWPDPGN